MKWQVGAVGIVSVRVAYGDLHLLHNTDLTLNVEVKFKQKLMWSFVTTQAIKI